MQRKIIPGVINGEQALCCLAPDATAREAADLMLERRIGAVVVVDQGKLVGIVTERDLTFKVVATGADSATTRLSEIMTASPETVRPDDLALAALEKMQNGRYRHLPVMRGDELCGMVSIRDLYEALRRTLQEELDSAESLIYGEQYGGA